MSLVLKRDIPRHQVCTVPWDMSGLEDISVWESRRLQETPWSPHYSESYTHVFSGIPGVRYHFSKEHRMLQTQFIEGETEAHPTQKVASHARHSVFSASHFVTGPRSKAMISFHYPPPSWHFHLLFRNLICCFIGHNGLKCCKSTIEAAS